jgi:hypothetical protein
MRRFSAIIAGFGLAVLLSSLFLLFQPGAAQEEPGSSMGPQYSAAQAQVIDLRQTETINFPAPGPNEIAGEIKCSPDGDIYAVYSQGTSGLLIQAGQPRGIFRRPVSKVSPSSRTVTEFPIPAIGNYQEVSREDFDVRPDDTLYALIGATRQALDKKIERAWYIVKYNDDGTEDSRVRVGEQPGKHTQPIRIGVFGDGSFLLSGTIVPEEKHAQLGSFSAIFGRDGEFESPIGLFRAAKPAPPSESGKPGSASREESQRPPTLPEAMAKLDTSAVSLASNTLEFSSQDGNVYVLQGHVRPHLYVVSPAGYVAREYGLKPPEEGLAPIQMAPVGAGYLFIEYEHIPTGAAGEDLHQRGVITVLSSDNGQVAGVYRVPSSAGFAVPACADSTGSFLFLGSSKDGHLQVLRYAPAA